MSTTEQVQSNGKYSAKWQERFDFFDTYGAPSDPRYKEAFKALPGFKKNTHQCKRDRIFLRPYLPVRPGPLEEEPGAAGYFPGDQHRLERHFRHHWHGVSAAVEHGAERCHVDDVRADGQLRVLPQGSERRTRLESVQRYASLIAGLSSRARTSS